MVLYDLSKNNQAATCESQQMELDSGFCIKYVAPAHAAILSENQTDGQDILKIKRKSSRDESDPRNDWEGVHALCCALDHSFHYVSEDMVRGRNVLETGFSTGLPSIFALANGANHITLHSMDKEMLDKYVKPTLSQNKINAAQHRILECDWEQFRESIKPNEFDVILAVEILKSPNTNFEQIHDIINYALSHNGICLLESRMYYHRCGGSLPEFLELVKIRGKLDVYVHWSSPKSEIVQRKVIQLTRAVR